MRQEHQSRAWVCAAIVLGTSVCGLGCGEPEDGARLPGPPPEAPESFGPPGSGFVTAGGIATSSKFALVFTVGQSTQNQETQTSSRHRLQGGVIGANESLP